LSAEIASITTQEEALTERFPHLSVPGFDKLPPDRQEFFAAISPDKFHLVRSVLEKEIAGSSEIKEEHEQCDEEDYQANTIDSIARPKKEQANTAIETFHRAANGDPEAKKDLLDQKKELLGEEPSDDEIFQTMLEDQSGMFNNNLVLEVALSDADTQQHQSVLDLYKEFRGDLASVDEAISPKQQIDLFIELTKGGGNLPNRMFLARKALTVLTSNGTRNLSLGLRNFHVLDGNGILQDGVDKLRGMADSREVTPDYA